MFHSDANAPQRTPRLLGVGAALLLAAALPVGAQGTPAAPVAASLEKLLDGRGFHLSLSADLSAEGAPVASLHAEGVVARGVEYSVEATVLLMGETTELRVTRIGDRQWRWSEGAGWLAERPADDPIASALEAAFDAIRRAEPVGDPKDVECEGLDCLAYAFTLPPGVAVFQDMPTEGEGVLTVDKAEGLPRNLELTVSTPIGAGGTVDVRFFDYGKDVEITPPGLGDPREDDGPELTSELIAQSLAGREYVRFDLEISKAGQSVELFELGLPITMSVTVSPKSRNAVVLVTSEGRTVNRLIALPDVRFECWSGADEPDANRDAVDDWTMGAVDASAADVPWNAHLETLDMTLGGAELTPDGTRREGERALWAYRFEALEEGQARGLILPELAKCFAGRKMRAEGAALVDSATSDLVSIDLTMDVETDHGAVSVSEAYTFNYAPTPAERDAIAAQLAWARNEARRRSEIDAEMRQGAERLARESAFVIGDEAGMAIRLGVVDREERMAYASFLAPDAARLASRGEDPLPEGSCPTEFLVESAKDLDAGESAVAWVRGVCCALAPIRNRDGLVGYALVASTPGEPAPE